MIPIESIIDMCICFIAGFGLVILIDMFRCIK